MRVKHTRGIRRRVVKFGIVALLVLGCFWVPSASANHTVGAQRCAECHESEVEVWKRTAHQAHARTLTRTPETRSIAKALGVRRVKNDARCTSCHFTLTKEEGHRVRASSGVSCESCHGPAKDWIDIHGNYGGPNVTRATEPVTHRKQRVATSDAAGMHRVDDLYDLAAACYSCHVIDDEELINKGGHPVGRPLDFVTYTQGEMRHNFVRGERDENRVSDLMRQQQMYVVSRIVELEHALRALSQANEAGDYAQHQATLVRRTLAELQEIEKHAPSDDVQRAIESASGLDLDEDQRDAVLAAADQVRGAGQSLAKPHRAQELAGVRDLMARPNAAHAEP